MRKHSRAVNPTGVFWARHLYLEVTSPTTLARMQGVGTNPSRQRRFAASATRSGGMQGEGKET